MATQRLDKWLVAHGLAETRSKAQAMIDAGAVWLNGQELSKHSQNVADDAPITLKHELLHPWASRGGLKLDHALTHFTIDVANAIALDVGASTGGFTDVLLTRGAAKVYAVDAGHDQLIDRLRHDPRVIVLEHCNARGLDRTQIPEMVNVITCDVSFISLALVLPGILALAAPKAQLIALIKPQFEVGKDKLGKGGVVKEAALHQEVCERLQAWVDAQTGWKTIGITESPVQEPGGNKEFLLYAVMPS